jgi:hypothetical protein
MRLVTSQRLEELEETLAEVAERYASPLETQPQS